MEARRLYWEMGNLPGVLITLADMALLRAFESEPLTAISWLGMVLAHPALAADGRLRSLRVLDQVKSGTPTKDVDESLARGAALEVELVLAQVDEWILQK